MTARPNASESGRHRRYVAVEGLCCAGKTTLSRGLITALGRRLSLCHARDYADHVGGGRFLPRPVPDSVAEDQMTLQRLLTIEADRLACAHAVQRDLMLLDRSVYTLLAHRYAAERMTGLPCLAPAQRVLASSAVVAWPDLVLYLDVTDEAIHQRNRGKFEPGNIFIDASFNTGIRGFYTDAATLGDARIVRLDATLKIPELLKTAEAHVDHLMHNRCC